MKRLFLIGLYFSFFIPLFSQEADSVSYISLNPSQFREELTIITNPVIADVREFFEYKRFRLKGAVNMPASGSIDIPADTLDLSTHLFLYCTSGFRSKRVAQKFVDRGFIHVYSLDGGVTKWKKEGYPIEKKRIKRRK